MPICLSLLLACAVQSPEPIPGFVTPTELVRLGDELVGLSAISFQSQYDLAVLSDQNGPQPSFVSIGDEAFLQGSAWPGPPGRASWTREVRR